ncbi:GNAT family N-acetyltransferase [uncultured Megasphaera sp.]|uniref:GNAT family N-acetyltransferase n=1 Tax=uncultured Megasphaera sp. TaxID=165188 RepID=UPI002595E984|nr:GNAT family N-acetyltransferase [uncultured Megasphaera sp.]
MKIIDGTERLAEIKELIIEYTDSLHMDLGFQHLSEELDHLDTHYVYPYGRLLAAVCEDGTLVGCVAYHRRDGRSCEMKRLYVRPAWRHRGAGQKLVAAIMEQARADGYREMVLDSFTDTMQSAIRMYEAAGFHETDAYYDNPMPNVIYMKCEL